MLFTPDAIESVDSCYTGQKGYAAAKAVLDAKRQDSESLADVYRAAAEAIAAYAETSDAQITQSAASRVGRDVELPSEAARLFTQAAVYAEEFPGVARYWRHAAMAALAATFREVEDVMDDAFDDLTPQIFRGGEDEAKTAIYQAIRLYRLTVDGMRPPGDCLKLPILICDALAEAIAALERQEPGDEDESAALLILPLREYFRQIRLAIIRSADDLLATYAENAERYRAFCDADADCVRFTPGRRAPAEAIRKGESA